MIIALAMTVIIGMAAFAIDVGQWYVKRHQAQVVADAAALAAANCLATTKCTQTTPTGDAHNVATDPNYRQGGVTVTVVSFTSSTVSVKAQGTASGPFAGAFGIPAPTVSAVATASYSTLNSVSFQCATTGSTSCISMFAGNTYCPSSTPSTTDMGLDFNSTGGGGADISYAYTNGFFNNNANSSGTWNITGVSCKSDNYSGKNTTLTTTSSALPYPAVWTQPTTACDSASSWSTGSITAGGIYCVSSGPTGGCKDGGTGAGYISIDLSSLPAGQYEFVGPCVNLSGSNSSVTNIAGQPLVYGTSNITTKATSASLPTCTVNDGSNGTSTWFDGNNLPLDAPIYDQCGTVEITGNKVDFVGFIEAWNIVSDKNSGAVTGTGPTSPSGGGETKLPGSDLLTN